MFGLDFIDGYYVFFLLDNSQLTTQKLNLNNRFLYRRFQVIVDCFCTVKSYLQPLFIY